MCGIAGIIKPKDKSMIEGMTRYISHRGPDDEGYFSDDAVGLGMRRLAIIDLSRGKQPISSADERFLIFFNGEIYNYKELKEDLGDYPFKTESDTEVILALYLKFGTSAFKRLRGMFTFAIYDKVEKKLVLARDFFGIKPMYFWVGENPTKNALSSPAGDARSTPADAVRDVFLKDNLRPLAFSSEIKSFFKIPGFVPEVNDEAVFNYLSYQYNPLDETFFKGVYKLPPGHFMEVDANTGSAKIEKYWEFEFKQDESLDEDETREKVFETMKDSVKHHMIADVPVGSFLSGGIDSSVIATLMQMERGDPSTPLGTSKKVKTFTVGFESLSEANEARQTSDPLGTDHTEITIDANEYFKSLPKVVWHFDEPVADPSALGLYFLAREAAKHVKVVLSGEGADELFGGYNIYLEPFARRWISWIPKALLRLIINAPFSFRGQNFARRALSTLEERYIGNASIFTQEEIAKLWTAKLEETHSLKSLYEKVSGLKDSTKMQYIDIHTWLIGDILAKADKMTMAHSLELRVPFLDRVVANLASTLPDKLKWRRGETKYILREAFKNVLPESTRKRPKLGFPTPVRNWFTKEREDIYSTIRDNEYIKNHMDEAYIEELIKNHTERRADNSRKIYLLLILAIWYNVFIKANS